MKITKSVFDCKTFILLVIVNGNWKGGGGGEEEKRKGGRVAGGDSVWVLTDNIPTHLLKIVFLFVNKN